MRALDPHGLSPSWIRAHGHIDYGLLPKLPLRPGQPTAVVAVRGRDENQFAELFTRRRAAQTLKAQLCGAKAQAPTRQTSHSIGAAQGFEGLQAEAARLVLDEYAPQTEKVRQGRQLHKRRGRVFLKTLMKGAGRLRRVRGESGGGQA